MAGFPEVGRCVLVRGFPTEVSLVKLRDYFEAGGAALENRGPGLARIPQSNDIVANFKSVEISCGVLVHRQHDFFLANDMWKLEMEPCHPDLVASAFPSIDTVGNCQLPSLTSGFSLPGELCTDIPDFHLPSTHANLPVTMVQMEGHLSAIQKSSVTGHQIQHVAQPMHGLPDVYSSQVLKKTQEEQMTKLKQKQATFKEDGDKETFDELPAASMFSVPEKNETDGDLPEFPKERKIIKSTAVKVTGFSEDTDADIVEMFFENQEKSGGGAIEKLDWNPETREAVIIFTELQAVERVLGKSTIKLLGAELSASPMKFDSDNTTDNAILVQGIKENTKEDVLVLFFENAKRSGGGKVKNIKMLGRQSAVIFFENSSVVDRVLDKGDLVLCNCLLQVSRYCPMIGRSQLDPSDAARSLKVSGFKPGTTCEALELFFENRKKSGGGKVTSVTMNIADGTALVVFKNIHDAQNVSRNHNLTLGGQSLKSQLMLPPTPVNEDLGHQSEGNTVLEESISAVKIEGIPPRIPLDTLKMLFENERRSGGGSIKDVQMLPGGDKAMIVFEKAETAERVCQYSGLKLSGQSLMATMYPSTLKSNADIAGHNEPQAAYTCAVDELKPAQDDTESVMVRKEIPEDSLTILEVQGIKPGTSTETLKLYFENKRRSGGGEVLTVHISSTADSAFITFKDPEVAQRVLAQENLKLGGAHLRVRPASHVEQSSHKIKNINTPAFPKKNEKAGSPASAALASSFEFPSNRNEISGTAAFFRKNDSSITPSEDGVVIEVRGFKTDTTEDALMYFFENTKRSGGGDVESVTLYPDEKVAQVTFCDKTVAERVLGRERLLLEGEPLSVRRPQAKSKSAKTIADPRASLMSMARRGVISIKGIPRDMSRETLEDIFENKRRSGGGEIKDIIYDPEAEVAEIEFEDVDVADHVLQKGSLRIGNHTLELFRPPEIPLEPSCKVQVSNLPPGVNEDTLTFFFENKKRSGGGDVESVELNLENGMAIVTFSDSKDAERVSQRKELYMNKVPIQVCLYPPIDIPISDRPAISRDGGSFGESDLSYDSVMTASNSCAVTVMGVATTTKEMTLKLYFGNRRRSGGGKIRSVYYCSEKGIYTITFEDPEVAQRVLQKAQQLEGQDLTVQQLTPVSTSIVSGPVLPHIVLVRGITADISCDQLILHLEDLTTEGVKEIAYGLDPSLALVEFDGRPNFGSLSYQCSHYPFLGTMLGIERVAVPLSAQVFGIGSISEETLAMHFESRRRSGGCEDIEVSLLQDHGCAIVKCPTTEVLNRILSNTHLLEGHQLMLDVYYPCLGVLPPNLQRSDPTRIPKGTSVSVAGIREMNFLCNCPEVKQQFNAILEPCHAIIKWEEIDPATGQIYIYCTLAKGDPEALVIAHHWEGNIKSVAQSFLKQLVSDELRPLQEIWPKLKSVINKFKFPSTQVQVQLDDQTCLLVITGFKDKVVDVYNNLNEIIQALQEELDRAAQTITESIKLRAVQCRSILDMKFAEHVSDNWPDLQINIHVATEEVILIGLPKEVTEAKMAMYELLQSMINRRVQMADLKLRLLSQKETRDHIVKMFHPEQVVAVWEAEGPDLVVHAPNQKHLDQALKIINGEISSAQLDIVEDTRLSLKTSDWTDLLSSIQTRYQGLQIIESNADKSILEIASVTSVAPAVLEDIKRFLDENTILDTILNVTPGQAEIVTRHMEVDIHSIEKDFASCAVLIQPIETEDGVLLQVKGNKNGLRQAEKRILQLTETVICQQHQINQPGMPKYLKSERGRQFLDGIEAKLKVVIHPEIEMELKEQKRERIHTPTTQKPSGPQEICRVKDPNGPFIIVFVDDLTMHSVDIIVNAANRNLDHIGGLAKALCDKGGPQIQHECRAFVRDKGVLLDGQVAMTGAGKLPCKRLLHAVGPIYMGGTRGEDNLLYEVTWTCLEEAQKLQSKTIALPAISTGVFKFPLQRACKILVEAIQGFFQENKTSSLREVHLVDNTHPTTDAFAKAITQVYRTSSLTASSVPSKSTGVARPVAAQVAPTQTTHHGATYMSTKNKNQLKTPEGLIVTIVKGAIASQVADVILNTCATNLNLSQGAVSGSILQAAGPGLQAEVSAKSPGGNTCGHIVETSGHNLQCQEVFHGSCANWNGGAGNTEQMLRQLVATALTMANQNGYTSIALPAIGTGNLGFPRDVVARAMYEEVAEFSQNATNMSLTDVRFVVYDRDQPTIDAFKAELKCLANGASVGGGVHPTRKRGVWIKPNTLPSESPQGQQFYKGQQVSQTQVSGEDWVQIGSMDEEEARMYGDVNVPQQGQQQMQIGPILLQVQGGDLTRESTDAIVNSTNQQLDLSVGAVSQAIVRVGGPMIVEECMRLGGLKSGIAVTSGGTLPAKKVIHIEAAHHSSNWKKVIKRCLQEADKMGLQSIAFPALGTGQISETPGKMAATMMETISQFCRSSNPLNLKLVRVTIFQQHMVDVFHQEMNKKVKQSKGFLQSTWDSIKDFMGMSPDNEEELGAVGGSAKWGYRSPRKTARSVGPTDPSNMILNIYGMSEKSITLTKEKIDEICKAECQDKVIGGVDSDPHAASIKKLTTQQINRIKDLEQIYSVRIEIRQGVKVNRIRVQGGATDLVAVMEKIHSLFHEADSETWRQREAELIGVQVNWEYYNGTKYEKYPDDVNALIEKAYQEKKPVVEWSEKGEDNILVTYQINFKSKKESVVGNPSESVSVQRHDLTEDATGIPDTWSAMASNKHYLLVSLKSADAEYSNVAQLFQSTIRGRSQTIVKIERVQNPNLYRRYMVHKEHMNQVNPSGNRNERFLWHGTDDATLESINTHGFNRSYCGKNATVYGNGVYFATTSQYSHGYTSPDVNGDRHMYLTRVLTGEFTTGKQSLKVPPPKDPNKPSILFDSVVDNVGSPSIFVIFSDTQAYPEFLVTFK